MGKGEGGLELGISSFEGPCEIARANRRVQFGAQRHTKLEEELQIPRWIYSVQSKYKWII